MRQTKARASRGFTLIELLVVVAIIALLISILLPSLARARELSKRTVCAANMKGIGTGFAAYATGNQDDWPIPAHMASTLNYATKVIYVGKIGYRRGLKAAADAGESFLDSNNNGDPAISTTRAFWYLVRSGTASPKSFICPSSEDQPNSEDNPQNYWDFGVDDSQSLNATATVYNQSGSWGAGPSQPGANGYKQCSYGYQVPFGKNGKPNPNVDQDMALAADKGPYGAWYEAGKDYLKNGSPAPWNGTSDTTVNDPSTSTYDTAGPNSTSGPDDWRRFNSPNHGGAGDGEGQNVLYPDGHADFATTPMAGTAKDNIYTAWSPKTGNTPGVTYFDRIQGNRPVNSNAADTDTAPNGATDSLIYP